MPLHHSDRFDPPSVQTQHTPRQPANQRGGRPTAGSEPQRYSDRDDPSNGPCRCGTRRDVPGLGAGLVKGGGRTAARDLGTVLELFRRWMQEMVWGVQLSLESG